MIITYPGHPFVRPLTTVSVVNHGPPLRRDVDPNEVQGRWHAPWHLEFSTSSRPRNCRLKKKRGQGENVQKTHKDRVGRLGIAIKTNKLLTFTVT